MVVARLRLRLVESGHLLAVIAALVFAAPAMAEQVALTACAVPMIVALIDPRLVPPRLHGWCAIISSLLVPSLALARPTSDAMARHGFDGTSLCAILLLLTGSRVLVALNDQHNAALWRRDEPRLAPMQRQSPAAAILLGLALALTLHGAVATWQPSSTDPILRTLLSALAGGTLVHAAILALFFTILAWLADGWLLHLADRAVVARAVLDGPSLATLLRQEGHRPAVALLAAAQSAVPPLAEEQVAAQQFDQASRRFVRSLVPLLPLLGFLGTVLGLSRAMSELHLTGAGADLTDLSGMLSGLALKFETTLLGLLASMVASLLISLLDKQESEFHAACLLAGARLAARRTRAP